MQSLQQGAAAGVILVVLKLVAYLLGIEAMTSGWVGFGQLVLVVAGMFLACTMERKAVAGAFTFGSICGGLGRRGDHNLFGTWHGCSVGLHHRPGFEFQNDGIHHARI